MPRRPRAVLAAGLAACLELGCATVADAPSPPAGATAAALATVGGAARAAEPPGGEGEDAKARAARRGEPAETVDEAAREGLALLVEGRYAEFAERFTAPGERDRIEALDADLEADEARVTELIDLFKGAGEPGGGLADPAPADRREDDWSWMGEGDETVGAAPRECVVFDCVIDLPGPDGRRRRLVFEPVDGHWRLKAWGGAP